MPENNALTSKGSKTDYLARGQKCSAQTDRSAGLYIKERIFSKSTLAICLVLRGLNRLFSLINRIGLALFISSQSAYNVSLGNERVYNNNCQENPCQAIPLRIGLFIALFCGKSAPEDSFNLTPIKLKTCIAIIFLMAFFVSTAYAEPITIKASWYSIESLKKEGTFKTSRGVMSNGEIFSDNGLTCANRLFPMGTILKITNIRNNKSVVVRTTDRIGKRFAQTRIDLSKSAFDKIACLDTGVIQVRVEVSNER
jgi:hypothetical protein